jgi:putative GTP pyrophosphokinase
MRSKIDVKDILAEFVQQKPLLEELCKRNKDLVEAILKHAKIRFQSVQARVKDPKKLEEKYLDPKKDYSKLDDITDQAGLRIITYYEDDVDRVAKVIQQEFQLDAENCTDRRETDPDRFGYRAINYVCSHLPARTGDVMYRDFIGLKCEIQITSILSHAWSEIEHDWYDLKDAYPREIKRRFYRLIALMELAEAEFLDIRKYRTQLQKSMELRVEANILDLPVDAVSMRSFIEKEPLVVQADKLVAAALNASYDTTLDIPADARAKAANVAGASNLIEVRDLLGKYLPMIEDFARRGRQELWSTMPAGRPMPRGSSIHQLFLFLEASKGMEALTKFYEGTGMKKSESGEYEHSVVRVAQEVLKKASS